MTQKGNQTKQQQQEKKNKTDLSSCPPDKKQNTRKVSNNRSKRPSKKNENSNKNNQYYNDANRNILLNSANCGDSNRAVAEKNLLYTNKAVTILSPDDINSNIVIDDKDHELIENNDRNYDYCFVEYVNVSEEEDNNEDFLAINKTDNLDKNLYISDNNHGHNYATYHNAGTSISINAGNSNDNNNYTFDESDQSNKANVFYLPDDVFYSPDEFEELNVDPDKFELFDTNNSDVDDKDKDKNENDIDIDLDLDLDSDIETEDDTNIDTDTDTAELLYYNELVKDENNNNKCIGISNEELNNTAFNIDSLDFSQYSFSSVFDINNPYYYYNSIYTSFNNDLNNESSINFDNSLIENISLSSISFRDIFDNSNYTKDKYQFGDYQSSDFKFNNFNLNDNTFTIKEDSNSLTAYTNNAYEYTNKIIFSTEDPLRPTSEPSISINEQPFYWNYNDSKLNDSSYIDINTISTIKPFTFSLSDDDEKVETNNITFINDGKDFDSMITVNGLSSITKDKQLYKAYSTLCADTNVSFINSNENMNNTGFNYKPYTTVNETKVIDKNLYNSKPTCSCINHYKNINDNMNKSTPYFTLTSNESKTNTTDNNYCENFLTGQCKHCVSHSYYTNNCPHTIFPSMINTKSADKEIKLDTETEPQYKFSWLDTKENSNFAKTFSLDTSAEKNKSADSEKKYTLSLDDDINKYYHIDSTSNKLFTIDDNSDLLNNSIFSYDLDKVNNTNIKSLADIYKEDKSQFINNNYDTDDLHKKIEIKSLIDEEKNKAQQVANFSVFSATSKDLSATDNDKISTPFVKYDNKNINVDWTKPISDQSVYHYSRNKNNDDYDSSKESKSIKLKNNIADEKDNALLSLRKKLSQFDISKEDKYSNDSKMKFYDNEFQYKYDPQDKQSIYYYDKDRFNNTPNFVNNQYQTINDKSIFSSINWDKYWDKYNSLLKNETEEFSNELASKLNKIDDIKVNKPFINDLIELIKKHKIDKKTWNLICLN